MALLDHFGQPELRKQLDTLLAQGRLPHAILFYGEPGYGTLPAALSLAHDILCTQPVEGKACHHCPSCHRAAKWIHPDMHFLLPLAGAKSISTDYYDTWRDAIQSNPWMTTFQWTQFCEVEGKQVDIHKEDIQRTTGHLALQAYEGGNKVMIIWMAQFLAREGNRLLKMIEEPPEQTYFILISNQREQILPTIRSRCMQLHVPPMAESEMARLLHTEYEVEPGQARLISKQSVNDMGRALALARNHVMHFQEELTTWFRALIGRKGHELVAWSNKMGSQEKEEQKQFALYAISFIRKILQTYGRPEMLHAGEEGTEMITYVSQHFRPDSWHHMISGLQNTFEKIARNANTKLAWLSVSIRIKNQLAVSRLQHINT